MDESCNYHTFQLLIADREKWVQVQDPLSVGCAKYMEILAALARFTNSFRRFQQHITEITEKHFEPPKRRNSGAYADAYACFYSQTLSIDAWLYGENSEQNLPMEVCFVPMIHPYEEGAIFIMEKAPDFFRMEFYGSLAIGNVPRRCYKGPGTGGMVRFL